MLTLEFLYMGSTFRSSRRLFKKPAISRMPPNSEDYFLFKHSENASLPSVSHTHGAFIVYLSKRSASAAAAGGFDFKRRDQIDGGADRPTHNM